MSRKDYVKVAAIIKDSLPVTGARDPQEYRAGVEDASKSIANDLARLFAQDNPRVDRERFFEACGMAGNL